MQAPDTDSHHRLLTMLPALPPWVYTNAYIMLHYTAEETEAQEEMLKSNGPSHSQTAFRQGYM